MKYTIPCLFGWRPWWPTSCGGWIFPRPGGNGRVLFSGEARDMAKANICLRTGERVLLVLGTFLPEISTPCLRGPVPSPGSSSSPGRAGSLSRGTALIPPPFRACLPIHCEKAPPPSGDAYGLNTLPETGALFQIQFSIMKDTAV